MLSAIRKHFENPVQEELEAIQKMTGFRPLTYKSIKDYNIIHIIKKWNAYNPNVFPDAKSWLIYPYQYQVNVFIYEDNRFRSGTQAIVGLPWVCIIVKNCGEKRRSSCKQYLVQRVFNGINERIQYPKNATVNFFERWLSLENPPPDNGIKHCFNILHAISEFVVKHTEFFTVKPVSPKAKKQKKPSKQKTEPTIQEEVDELKQQRKGLRFSRSTPRIKRFGRAIYGQYHKLKHYVNEKHTIPEEYKSSIKAKRRDDVKNYKAAKDKFLKKHVEISLKNEYINNGV